MDTKPFKDFAEEEGTQIASWWRVDWVAVALLVGVSFIVGDVLGHIRWPF